LVQVNTTRAAILDAAEGLFADANFDIVSIRDVAAKARVSLGLVCYHFHTKGKLYEAVIERRSDELNARQFRAFKRLPAEFELRHAIDVYLRSYLELMLRNKPGWRSYGRILAQTGRHRRKACLFARHFKQTQGLFLDALIRAEPRLSKEAVTRGYVFMLSVMFEMFAESELLSVGSDKVYPSRDIEAAYAYAVPFLAGAFEGLLAAESVNVQIRAVRSGERQLTGQSG
jgi:AcrR family transcriptional regulator